MAASNSNPQFDSDAAWHTDCGDRIIAPLYTIAPHFLSSIVHYDHTELLYCLSVGLLIIFVQTKQYIKRKTCRQFFNEIGILIIPFFQRRHCWKDKTVRHWFKDVLRGKRDHVGIHNSENIIVKRKPRTAWCPEYLNHRKVSKLVGFNEQHWRALVGSCWSKVCRKKWKLKISAMFLCQNLLNWKCLP